ncbi:MAG TPA: hypothetical protein VE954_27460 [Oligoflexus sp.]|uniref:hypothetical protein n=1 Tax=Oligoflexus sp. TaxID=1971216 RepID=UPI002D44BD64|nr:hypothetical protein [Oligoflexus sp.]HYX36863.1 hypothetical protein [Oligoflexus sp.]
MKRRMWLCIFVASSSFASSCGKKDNDKKSTPVADPNLPIVDPQPSDPKKEPVLVTRGELSCYDHGGYLTGCTMADKVLSEKLTAISKFNLEYSFACSGHQMAIAVQFGDLTVALKQEADQKIELIGNGPFVLKDSNPDWSKSADLEPGCSLNILNFTVSAI